MTTKPPSYFWDWRKCPHCETTTYGQLPGPCRTCGHGIPDLIGYTAQSVQELLREAVRNGSTVERDRLVHQGLLIGMTATNLAELAGLSPSQIRQMQD